MFVGRIVGLKPNHGRRNAVKQNPGGKEEFNSQYKSYGNILTSQSERNVEKLKKKEKYIIIEHKYRAKKKGLNVLLELKQRIQGKATKIKKYDQRIEHYRINRLFQQD